MNEVFKNIIEHLKERQKKHLTNMEMVSDIHLKAIHEARAYGYYEAIEIVKQSAKEYNNGWIPASQPPEIIKYDDDKTGVVILQNKYGEINIGIYKQGSFHSMYKKDPSYLIKDDSIVYWQPFPKPITISNTWKQQIMDRFERM